MEENSFVYSFYDAIKNTEVFRKVKLCDKNLIEKYCVLKREKPQINFA